MSSTKVLEDLLERRLAQKRFRQLHPFTTRLPQDPSLNFAYQDLFFLSGNHFIKSYALGAVSKWGSGYHHFRPLHSHLDEQRKIEESLSSLLGKKHVFLFNSAEPVHHIILSALSHPKCHLFIDKKLPLFSFTGKGPISPLDLKRFAPQENVANLIATETLFPQTGEFWHPSTLLEEAKKHECLLYVDDSSAFGVYGLGGAGLAKEYPSIDITLIHFQSTFALPIAALSVSPFFAEFLHHYLEPLPPLYPSLLGALQGTLELLPNLEEERRHIHTLSHWLRHELTKQGWNIGTTTSHIIPLYLQNKGEVKSLSQFLADQGILSYPSSGKEAPAIRFLIHSKHTPSSLKHLTQLLNTFRTSPS